MKAELRVVGLLLAVTSLAAAEMRTWTFEKNGKTIEGEVVSLSGSAVNLKRPDGKMVSVPIAYLTESNRLDLAAEGAALWKEVEVVKLEGTVSTGGRYKKCAVKGKEVSGTIVIELLPPPVEVILNNRNQQASQIADLADRIENKDRAVARADAVTPTGAGGDAAYVNAVMAQRAQVNLAIVDLAQAKADLAKLETAYADYIDQTRAATIVKVKNTGIVYMGSAVWECFDPRKQQQ